MRLFETHISKKNHLQLTYGGFSDANVSHVISERNLNFQWLSNISIIVTLIHNKKSILFTCYELLSALSLCFRLLYPSNLRILRQNCGNFFRKHWNKTCKASALHCLEATFISMTSVVEHQYFVRLIFLKSFVCLFVTEGHTSVS